MTALLRALSAEALKLRGTLAVWMCLIAPGVVVALMVLQLGVRDLGERPPVSPAEAWAMFGLGVATFWSILMLPLFVTLESALLAGLEHGNQQWKHLLALPGPRSAHYLAKQLALVTLVLLAMVALLVLTVAGGAVLGHWQPRLGIAGPPPLGAMSMQLGAVFATSLLMLALHNWVSIRWRSFTVAVSFGMTATVAGYLIGQSERFGPFYPWSMPMQVFAADGARLGPVMAVAVVGAVAVAGLGLWDFLRRDHL